MYINILTELSLACIGTNNNTTNFNATIFYLRELIKCDAT